MQCRNCLKEMELLDDGPYFVCKNKDCLLGGLLKIPTYIVLPK